MERPLTPRQKGYSTLLEGGEYWEVVLWVGRGGDGVGAGGSGGEGLPGQEGTAGAGVFFSVQEPGI